MNATTTDVNRVGALSHEEAMSLQATELNRTVDLLRGFSEADWEAQTDCPDWDVRRMYLHVLGACEAATSIRENAHQMLAAKRHQKAKGGPLEASLSAVQIQERLDVDQENLAQRIAEVAPVTVHKRTKLPSLVRRAQMNIDGPVVEKWTLGYLVDTIYLRDLWMHRIDAARATHHELVLSPGHDARIVADVVAEWSRRHGQPFQLELTGPAGGAFTSAGSDPDTGPTQPEAATHELDAVEFCRILAGRAEGEGILSTIVPF